jgi:hypothetical protein
MHPLFTRMLWALSLFLVISSNAQAEADANLWPVVKEAFFAQRDIQPLMVSSLEKSTCWLTLTPFNWLPPTI